VKNKERIVIVTDAWFPQTNGVVTTLSNMVERLKKDYEVLVINPSMFYNFKLHFYKEIMLSIPKGMKDKIIDFDPDYIHIATEGPLGIAARRYCEKNNKQYNTSLHTNFPYLMNQMFFIPENITWRAMRYFHKGSSRVLVTNDDMKDVLTEKKFMNDLVVWSRGIDQKRFFYKERINDTSRITVICVSRVSKEKNLKEFCKLSKNPRYNCILVGDGPYLEKLKRKYPGCIFVGKVPNDKLHEWYGKADVFFFPSIFDTFGIVMLESIACGTPVVAYNVTGPRTLIKKGENGYLIKNKDQVHKAIRKAKRLNRLVVSQSINDYTWENVTRIFIDNMSKA